MEIWLPVKNYEGLYEISSRGRIKSLHRIQSNNNRCWPETVLKNQKHSKGYLQIYLCVKNKKVKFFIHRLVAEHFLPTDDTRDYVNHKDKDRTNNTIENLEWTTHEENMHHRDNYNPDEPF